MTHKVRTENFVKKMSYGTLRELFAAFIAYKEREGHRSTVNEYKILLDQLIKRKLITGNETANEITPAQVTQWLQSWAKNGFLAQADKIRKKLHAVFAYGIVADNDPLGTSVANGIEFNIPHNPTTNIQKMNASKPGERYLSFAEIRKIDLIFKESPFELEQDLKSLLMPGIYTCGKRSFELAHAQKAYMMLIR